MIHSYTLGGFHIVLDVHSGAVHVLDDLGMKMVSRITPPMERECPQQMLYAFRDEYETGDIVACWEELYALYEAEQLFSCDSYGEFADKMTLSPVKAICLHVAHDCNLRCQYCFAGTGEYSGKRSVMETQTGKKAIDFLLKYSQGRRNLEVDFFGGEPLLNFPLIREVVAYARSLEKEHDKRFRFTLTTNGVLLDDEKIEFINREMYNVVLSLDGREQTNDRMRKTIAGGGSYDIILPKFQKLVAGRGDGQYYVRGTFTKYNLDFSKDLESLYEAGFEQLSIEPVVAPESADYAITQRDLPRIFTEYEHLAQEMLKKRKRGKCYSFFHFLLDLEQGPCAIKRLRGCGSGNEYVAVTPDAEIYPCHQFVGMPEFCMGSLLDMSLDTAIKSEFAAANVYNKPACRDCWAKFYCSGGCNANNHVYGGSIKTPYTLTCELEKKRIECAVMMKAAELIPAL